MPLKLGTPQTITHTIDTYQMIVFSFNFTTHSISVGWYEGNVDPNTNQFNKVNERWITLYSNDVVTVVSDANSQIGPNADIMKAITQALNEKFGAVSIMSVDLDKMEMSVELAPGRWSTIGATDTQALIQRASQLAGGDVYTPLKTALYNKIQQITGVTGTVL